MANKKKQITALEILDDQLDRRTSRHGAKLKKQKWDIVPHESKLAFSMFEHFLHSETRNLAETTTEFKMDMAFTSDLYNKYAWESRALAFDHQRLNDEIGIEVLQPSEVTAKTTKERHIKMADLGETVATKGLYLWDKYLNEAKIADDNGIDRPKAPPITVEQIVRIADSFTKLKRLTIGEATTITENRTVDLKKLDNDVLEKMLAAAKENVEGEEND